MSSRYDLTRTRGGKDDMTIEDVLKDNCDALRRGDKVDIKLLRVSPWQGKNQVDIQSNCADFLDRKEHTFSPAPIRAAVRVLHSMDSEDSLRSRSPETYFPSSLVSSERIQLQSYHLVASSHRLGWAMSSLCGSVFWQIPFLCLRQ